MDLSLSIHLCLMLLIIMFMLMKKSLFATILMLSLASCKSIGFHVTGHSTILRNDTICTTIEASKPLNRVVNLDY